jgi:ribonuclease BN (tRNA processing enzyme)
MIRLTVLGACGTYPSAGKACSGYLVEAGSGGRRARVWVDTGSGTLANLLRYANLPELDAIWLSHLHVDHSSDLPVALYALRYGGLDPPPSPVPVYGPAGWAEHVGSFALQESLTAIEEAFEVHELQDRERVRLGPLELTAMATVHSVETYGLRASAAGATLAYSADSGPCDALAELADGADLFLCESAWSEWPAVAEPIHMTPDLAGEWAARAGAHRLLLTHLRPGSDPVAAVERARAAAPDLPVDLATESATYEVGDARGPGDPDGLGEAGTLGEAGIAGGRSERGGTAPPLGSGGPR